MKKNKNTDNERCGRGRFKEQKNKNHTHTSTHTQSQAVGREEKKCTDHLKHKKTLWTLDHKQHETDRTDP